MRLGFAIAAHLDADVAAPRRGLRRRRRGVPAQVLRQDLRVQAARRHDRLRLPRRVGGRAAVRARGAAARRAQVEFDGPTHEAIVRYRRVARRRGRSRPSARPACASGGPARRRSPRRGCSARRARSGSSSSPASRSRCGCGSRPRTGSRRRGSSSSCATTRGLLVARDVVDTAELGWDGGRRAAAPLRRRAAAARRRPLPPASRAQRRGRRAAAALARRRARVPRLPGRRGARRRAAGRELDAGGELGDADELAHLPRLAAR